MTKQPEQPKVIAGTQSALQSSGQCDCVCDCACSLPVRAKPLAESWQLSRLPAAFSLSRPSDSYTLALDEAHSVCYSPHHTLAVLNRAALDLLAAYNTSNPGTAVRAWRSAWGDDALHTTLAHMVSLGLLVPNQTPAPIDAINISYKLAAWLHVTGRCNLRCAYCYLPHTATDMSLETGYAALDATFRSALAHNYRQVKFKYAGGEPLLRFPFVATLHRYAQQQARRYHLDLDGVVLSNGTLLTASIVTELKALGLRLMISLDGIGDDHDCQRHFADGRGSFDAVAQAIDLALSHNLFPDISITISGRNSDGLPALLRWVLARELPFSLNFYRDHRDSVSQGGLRLEASKIITGMLAAYRVIEANLPSHSLLASLVDRANLSTPHARTCGVGHSYLVFDALGRVAKCQMAMQHSITDSADPDPLSTVRQNTAGILNLSVDKKEACRDCQWRYWCAGGCPLQTYRATGRYDAQSPNCAIYQALYPEVLRLEGLRLLEKL